MHVISDALYFPPVNQSSFEGILAVGGDLSPERLLLAYKSGIFPWFNPGEPILWWAPKSRMVLYFEDLTISKSMRNVLNRNTFKVTFNQDFRAVISNCSTIKREGQRGTWISQEMIEAYCKLNEMGIAKSVEVWQENQLGNVFCGESMFSKVSNASKVAFISLAQNLKNENYKVLDCQVYNEHLDSLGCKEIDRELFMEILNSES
jgi:leucyl/phenylalanyl-tRNA--protein transferase